MEFQPSSPKGAVYLFACLLTCFGVFIIKILKVTHLKHNKTGNGVLVTIAGQRCIHYIKVYIVLQCFKKCHSATDFLTWNWLLKQMDPSQARATSLGWLLMSVIAPALVAEAGGTGGAMKPLSHASKVGNVNVLHFIVTNAMHFKCFSSTAEQK